MKSPRGIANLLDYHFVQCHCVESPGNRVRTFYECEILAITKMMKITGVYARESNMYPAPDHAANTAAVSAIRNEKLSRMRLFLPSNI